ncbi:unnamed protein product, partial [Ilex paraguariensis]
REKSATKEAMCILEKVFSSRSYICPNSQVYILSADFETCMEGDRIGTSLEPRIP